MSKIVIVVALLMTISSATSIGLCKGCHGKQFEKKAMTKSKVVKDMSKAEIIAALKGYKKGTYGRSMKKVMKDQVAKLSNAQIESMATKIKK